MHSADFAFWWVTGALGGASVATGQSLNITVDSSDVQAVAWYLPAGGPGGPGGRPCTSMHSMLTKGAFPMTTSLQSPLMRP
jgi:hypothetical protein